MTGAQWAAVKPKFEEVSDLSASARADYLSKLAVDAPEICSILRQLLDEMEATSGLLDSPPWCVGEPTNRLPIEPGAVLANRYDVESFLGAGGAGEVFRAWDRQREMWVAIKAVKTGFGTEANQISAIRSELNLASRISHRNVCRLYDLNLPGPEDRIPPFFTMELIEGETLAQRARRQPFTEKEAQAIVEQLVAGLAAAHDLGIVHRDFKSANVMLTDNEQRVVIMDFGLARVVDPLGNSLATISQGLAGTPAYMAPEQIENKRPNAAFDIHALGVILYEMLTGQLPFKGDSAMAIASSRLNGEAPSPRELLPSLDRRWEHTILTCMARDPSRRPASVYEIPGLLTATPPLRHKRRIFVGAGLAAVTGCALLVWRRPDPFRPSAAAAQHLQNGRIYAQRRTNEGIENAIVEFQEACRLEPKWAEPHADLADTLATGANFAFLPSGPAMRDAKVAAETAIRLEPNLARAHASLAWILSLDFQKWPEAEVQFRRAVDLDSGNAQTRTRFAANLRKRGKFDEAWEQVNEAIKLRPDDAGIRRERTLLYFTMRRNQEFFAEAAEQRRLYPTDSINLLYAARSRAMQKDLTGAHRLLDESRRMGGNENTIAIERALAEAFNGNFEAARKYADQVRKVTSTKPADGLMLAGVYAQIQDFDTAFSVIEQAYRLRDTTLLSIATTPLIDPLRSDPRFAAWLERLGFPKA